MKLESAITAAAILRAKHFTFETSLLCSVARHNVAECNSDQHRATADHPSAGPACVAFVTAIGLHIVRSIDAAQCRKQPSPQCHRREHRTATERDRADGADPLRHHTGAKA